MLNKADKSTDTDMLNETDKFSETYIFKEAGKFGEIDIIGVVIGVVTKCFCPHFWYYLLGGGINDIKVDSNIIDTFDFFVKHFLCLHLLLITIWKLLYRS